MFTSSRMTRRDVLRIGAAGCGLALPALLHADAQRTTKPRAKSVVFLYLSGGPSQLDMWDPKPDAPAEIRGPFKPIRTSVVGTHITEHLPHMAKLAHKYTIIRSMSHNDTNHVSATYWAMTGGRLLRPVVQASSM